MSQNEAKFVKHEPCPQCGSKDNLAVYSDGGAHCFSPACGYHKSAKGEAKTLKEPTDPNLITDGQCNPLKSRKVSQKTCSFYGYEQGLYQNKPVQIANYRNDSGRVVAQKIRFSDKTFAWKGNAQAVTLYGRWLWEPDDRVDVIITEGEIDTLSVAEVQDCKWPVVSLPNGAAQAAQAIRKNADWLSGFRSVILCFDQDEAGREAVEQCVNILEPGKLKIMNLPMKDASEMLIAGRGQELIDRRWNAKAYSPAEIIVGQDIDIEMLKMPLQRGYELPYPKLNDMVRGLQKQRLTLLTAGSGIGKSTLAKEIGYSLFTKHDLRVGNIFLEEGLQTAVNSYIAIDNNVPLFKLSENPEVLSDAKWEASYEKLINNEKMVFFDHFGSLGGEGLLKKLEYMAVCNQVDFIILDHISIAISGTKSTREGERKDIDMLMTNLRSLIQRTGVGVLAIVHLKRKENKQKSFNDGGKISLTDLRGSAALEQLSDVVVGLERDQQGENSSMGRIRVLKNRVTGDTGLADTVYYNLNTGRMKIG